MEGLKIKYVLASFFLLLFTVNGGLSAQRLTEDKEPFALGLLVNNQNEEEAIFGAELAVEKINESGGIHGQPLKLIIRSIEGSWGAGSGEVVELVFKEKVKGMLGSIDGRNSHLAEQVIAKTQVLYVSAWASDPTLSKAYVPWYFSIVPTDDQQATVLLEEVYSKKKLKKVLVLHDQTYDAEQALKSLLSVSKGIQDIRIASLGLPSSESESDVLTSVLKNSEAEAIILLGRKLPLSDILQQLRSLVEDIPIYTNLSVQASEEFASSLIENNEQLHVIVSGHWHGSGPSANQNIFYKKHNRRPGPIAAYAYDGIMIMAEAFRQSENDEGSLLEAMSEINYQGLTGTIQFDSQGRLKSTGKLLLIKE